VANDLQILDWIVYGQFSVDWELHADMHADAPEVRYMLDRGFSVEDLQAWAIGFDSFSDRLTIPVCDSVNQLLGVKGRAWRSDEKMRYMVLGDSEKLLRRYGEVYGFPPYEKTKVVFGLQCWAPNQTFIVTEGEIDVMSFWKMGIPACATGSTVSPEQARIIREYANEAVFFFDDDEAGKFGLWGRDNDRGEHQPGAVELLEPFIRVRIVGPHKDDANDLLRNGQLERARALIDEALPSFAPEFASYRR
jgi:hypothetical protein